MSWQRPGAPPAPQRPPQLAQTFGDQQQQPNMYASYQTAPNAQNNTQQYWQQPVQPQYNQNQQYAQFPQTDYNNANQQQYNQTTQNYNASTATYPTQQSYQQGYYQPTQQPQVKTAENWDNWDWGWDEASRNQAQSNTQHVNNVNAQVARPNNANANVIEESFASSDTWNWTANDQRDTSTCTPNSNHNQQPTPELPLPVENNIQPSRSSSNHSAQAPVEEVNTLDDKEVVKDRMPNLALGKRFTLENLTPQWSIESQMSQESSDGPHTEGTYKSDNQSRNSSSPGPITDQVGFSYPHPVVEEYPPDWGRRDEPRGDGCDLTDGLQDLTISNREVPAPDLPPARTDSLASVSSASGSRLLENAPSSVSLSDLPPLPPPPASSQPPILLPPPTGFTTASGTNPFKQTSPFSHKKLPTSVASFPVSNFGANLETAPDNAERPDQPLPPPPAPLLPPTPDNLEVAPAPRRDRDEYLQTAHLTPDYGENTDFRSAPPVGLRRLVQGGAGDDPPPGLARLVPGQPSEYRDQMDRRSGRPELPGDGQASAPHPAPAAPPPAPREPLLDGADYAEQGADDREVTVDGENLQDLSAVSSTELAPETSASEPPRQHAMRPRSDADESDRDRDRAFNASPRRDKHKRDKDGRYSRGDRTYERDERHDDRRSTRDERRAADSPETRRRRRHAHARHNRYDTEDTDYYSDKERERRRYREGSHTSRPPRPDDKRRYNTIERDRTHRDKRDERDKHRDDRDKERDRYKEDKRYRDIDPHRPRGGTRARTHDDRTREERGRDREYSEGSRANSRERDRDRDRDDDDRRRRRRDHPTTTARHRDRDYYDGGYGMPAGGAGGGGGAAGGLHLTPQQYAYYETLRRTDPAAYLRVYTQLMAQYTPAPHAYAASTGTYEERGSGHSGRSSANAMRHDTYYGIGGSASSAVCAGVGGGGGGGGEARDGSLRHSLSMRTDISDRDLNTDASLNLQLEESTQRSGRVTPLKFSTAHVKGSISSRHIVVVRGAYPVDGRPGTVRVLALQGHALQPQLVAPTPLIKGVTHKKSVIEYCTAQARSGQDDRDPAGRALLWDLLALMLRQNGVVVGADIAELLMKNQREIDLTTRPSHSHTHAHARNDSRRGSSVSGRDEDPAWSPAPSPPVSQHSPLNEVPPTERASGAALDTLREYLTYGNRQEALEWAMSNNLWGHALHLATFSERRVRAHVAARFVASIPHTDPLHSLYSHLAAKQPPAATCCADERWGDWRTHAAIMLANASAKPEQDTRTLTQLGDSLASRGLLYSAQFCYLTAGVQFSKHPLAPLQQTPATAVPRLSLIAADPRAPTLAAFATDHAVFATEIYEYAMSLNQDYDIPDLQVYKLMMACRLIDCGLYERALAYIETAARAVTRQPGLYPPALAARLAELGDRLRYVDPAALDPAIMDDDTNDSPGRHHEWIDQVALIAQHHQAGSQQETPQHHQQEYFQPPPPPDTLQQPHYSWGDQIQTQSYQPLPQPAPPVNQTYADPEDTNLTNDYSALYHTQLPPAPPAPTADQPQPVRADVQPQPYYAEETPSYGDYWQEQYNYGETGGGGAARPLITMPGGNSATDYDRQSDDEATDRESESSKPPQPSKDKKPDSTNNNTNKGDKSAGWLGGILTKLSLRAPNQMILPDDKNPSIVWDAANKRWRNVDGSDEDAPAAVAPPPTLPKPVSTSSPLAPPSSALTSNIFKMQKGRHIKKSYVDVFNPSGAGPRVPPPAPAEVLPPAPAAAPHTYFVPQPANQSGIYEQTANEDSGQYSGI